MKIDLTHLSRPRQVALVIGYLTVRMDNRGAKPAQIYGSDLATRFKHRTAGVGAARLKFWNDLLRDACSTLHELAVLRAKATPAGSTAQPTAPQPTSP